MKKLLYVVLILLVLGALIIYELPAKRTIIMVLETEIPFDSCKHFFKNKHHWQHWINETPVFEYSTAQNDKIILFKTNDWGGYCTARRIKKRRVSEIESIENIELISSVGVCTIQWESILICNYPIGRISGVMEQKARQEMMKNRLGVLDSILKARYLPPPQTIDTDISIHEE